MLKLQRESKSKSIRAFTPFFPKPKEEGYWLVVGVEDELLYFKRITLLKEITNFEVTLATDYKGKYEYTVYLLTDCYLGLDQEYSFEIDI